MSRIDLSKLTFSDELCLLVENVDVLDLTWLDTGDDSDILLAETVTHIIINKFKI